MEHENAERQRRHERLIQESKQAHALRLRMLYLGAIPVLVLVVVSSALLFYDAKTALIVLSALSGGGIGWSINEVRHRALADSVRSGTERELSEASSRKA